MEMPRRSSTLRDLIAVWRLYIALRRIRPHVVHTHTPKGGLLGTVAAWLARVPIRIYAYSWPASCDRNRFEALAAKFREVAGDPERMARMSARNLAKAREYSDEVLRERRLAFYRYVREATETWIRAEN